jgi:tetratricopeptide (TPR) repeat protein
MKNIPYKTLLIVTTVLPMALLNGLLLAQTETGSIDGVVTDTQNHPLAGVKVSLDDQEQGRTEFTTSDSVGRFHFPIASASTYMVRARKSGYLEGSQGPFALKSREKTSLKLQLPVDKSSASANSAIEGMEYSDEPQFTVAGVSDPSDVGGHGSNVTLPTKEALAKDTASLSKDPADSGKGTSVTSQPRALPKVSPQDFTQNLSAGRELLQEGKAKDAIPYLEQAQKLEPQNYDATYYLAMAQLKNGDAKQAEQSAQVLATKSKQDRAELHGLLARVKEAEGQPVDAVKEYQRAAEIDPSEANLFSWGAELLLHRAYQPASEVFAKGHRLHPNSVRILVGLGAAAYAQDLNGEAARWLFKASELEPNDPRPYLFLGKVQEVAKSEPAEWVAVFARFAKLQPNNPLAHYYYAVALEKQKRGEPDFAARERELNRAVNLDPKFGDSYLKLGLLETERRDYPKAVASFEKAIELTPLPDEAHLRLAQVYRLMGEPEKARKESELYNEVAEKKKAQLDRERRELGQFVYSMQGESTSPEKSAPKPQ